MSDPRYFSFVAQHFLLKTFVSATTKKFQIDLKFFVVAETNILRKKRICKKVKRKTCVATLAT